MSATVVYECYRCGDQKLVTHNQKGIHPQIWCSCDGFNTMEIDPDTLGCAEE